MLTPRTLAASVQQRPAALAAPIPLPCRAAAASWRRSPGHVDAAAPSTSGASPSRTAPPRASRTCSRSVVAASALEGAQHTTQTGDGKVGVVIVDHGSRKAASNEMLVEFGRLYGDLTGHEIVEIAHMEIAAPTIEEAVGRCAARGASTVVVAPYFLSRGRHIQEDIPALVVAAQQRHPGLRCVIAEPIGIDALMVQLIRNRVASALTGSGAAAAAAAPEDCARV